MDKTRQTKLKTITCLGLFPLLLVACSDPEKAKVATVGGEVITLREFNEQVRTKPLVRVVVRNQEVNLPVAESLGFQGLEDLIAQRLLLQLAKSEGIEVTDKDVENEIEFRKKLNPRLVQELIAKGLSTDQIRSSIKLDLTQEKLLTKGITVTPQEVDEYIKTHPKGFMYPASADLVWVFARDEDTKRRVDQELLSGQKFQAVAIRYTQYPSARKLNARFPQTVLATLPKEIRDAVTKAGIGKPTGWIPIQGGFARFYMEQLQPERPVPIDDTRKQLVKRQLAVQRGMLANDLGKRLMKKFKETKIEVDFAPLKEPWKRLEEQLREMDQFPAQPLSTSPQGQGEETVSPPAEQTGPQAPASKPATP